MWITSDTGTLVNLSLASSIRIKKINEGTSQIIVFFPGVAVDANDGHIYDQEVLMTSTRDDCIGYSILLGEKLNAGAIRPLGSK